MEVYFYLDSNKKVKNPNRTIYCYVRDGRDNVIVLNTKEKVNPKHWNKDTKRALTNGKGKMDGARELNQFLDSFETEIKKSIREIRTDNLTADFQEIRKKLFEKFSGKSTSDVYNAIDKFIEVRKSDLTPGTLTKYSNLKKHLLDFEKISKTKLTFGSIDLMFYDAFVNFLIYNQKLNNNTAYKNITLLKTFLYWSYDRGINKYEYFRKFKKKEYEVDIITLSEDELKKIEELDLSQNLRLDRTKDLFLFACYTGARFSDIENISRADIKNGVWYLRQIKTRNVTEIPLIDRAMNILAKYEKYEKALPTITNQRLNQYLKELGENAGINAPVRISEQRGNKVIEVEYPKYELITTHTARRTFITLSLTRGMNPQIIMSITGHRTYNSFKKYINLVTADKEKALKDTWQKKPELKLVDLNTA
jgi:integrase